MDSLNRHDAERRIALVVDVATGGQGDGKGIKKHIAAIRRSVGLRDPGAKGARDFLRDFGGGL